jgi:hypothetical protein
MYYYLYRGDEVVDAGKQWGTKAASQYRGDKQRQAADEVLNDRKRP